MKFKFNYIKKVGNMQIDKSLEIEEDTAFVSNVINIGLEYLKEVEKDV